MAPIKALAVKTGNIPAKIKQQLVNAERRAKTLEIRDEKGEVRATQFAVEVRTVRKAVTAARDAKIKPLKAKQAQIVEMFAPLFDRVLGIDAILTEKLSEYRTKIAAKKDAKINRIIDKTETGNLGVEKAIAQINKLNEDPAPVKSDTGRVQYREELFVEDIDVSEVPREYMMPDVAKINAAIKEGKKIRGVKVGTKQIPMVYVTKG